MSDSHGWLPTLILLPDHGSDWDQYLNAIYAVFYRDFVLTRPATFEGKLLNLKRHPLEQGKEATFWHMISEGQVESERQIDLSRCERIAWPRAIIDADRSLVRRWENRRGTERRILLALDDFSYLVVLADRGDYVLPWTAYNVEQNHRREKLRREYEEFHKRLMPPP